MTNAIWNEKVLDAESNDEVFMGAYRSNELVAATPEVTATIFMQLAGKEHDGMVVTVVDV